MKRIQFKDYTKESFFIYLQDPYKISQDIWKWSEENMQKIVTFDHIATGMDTENTDSFYNLPLKTI